jgi:hypothetical protein
MTRKSYIKDGHIRWFNVDEERVYATIEIGGEWVSNPTLVAFLADGWQEYIVPVPEPYVPTYAELVEQYIREHGFETYGAELAIINNYAQDPTTYADAYAAYMQTRVEAKEWAEAQPHRD